VRRLLSGLPTCAVLVLSLLATLIVAAPAPAWAARQQDVVVSDDPVDYTPHVLDGTVFAIAQVGQMIVLGGDFTRARNAADGSSVLPRNHLLAFDKDTGVISTTFVPHPDDVVRTLAAAPNGTAVIVGGKFNSIDGKTAHKLAMLDVATGAVVPAFAPGLINALVQDAKVSAGRLFISGQFTEIGGVPRGYLAELDATTGALRPSVDLSFAGVVWSGLTQAYKMDVSPDGRRMVVIGNFDTVNGLTRPAVVQIDLSTQPAAVVDWVAPQWKPKCGSSPGTKFAPRDVSFSPDGSYFVIGATGGHTRRGTLCDGVTRWETAATGSVQPTWFAMTGGDSIYSVEATGTAVYVGGHCRWFNNPVYVHSFKGPGAVDREGIAALDPVTGVPLSWNPGRERGRGVWDFLSSDDGLWVASDTDRIGHFEYHGRIAKFPLAGGKPVPQPAPQVLPGDVQLVSPPGTRDGVVTRPGFDGTTAGEARLNSGAGTGWASTRGAFYANGSVYAARRDKTLVRYPVSGSTLGTPEAVDLNGLKRFGTEMRSMTSMFYGHGRVYYTLAGENALRMRFFTVESNIVGADEYVVEDGVAGVDWSTVGGAFLTDGALYFANSSTGNLSRLTWAADAPVAGTAVIVSGPDIDGIDWRARALFLTGVTAPSDIAPVAVAANVEQQTARERSVTVPPQVVAGDLLLLFWSSNSASSNPTAPADWTAVANASSVASTTTVWAKVADSDDAGSTVTVSTDGFLKADLVLDAYRKATLGNVAIAAETVVTDSHIAPTTDATVPGSWVVNYWADKSAVTSQWFPPLGVVTRFTSAGTGEGHVSELLADSGGPVPVGTVGGLTARADSPERNAQMVTIVLAPKPKSES
jgi:hypothetical protein